MGHGPLPDVEWIKAPDERTGREVWQITSGPAVSEAVYFEAQAFTGDERHLVFRSQRGGSSDIWRCELATGRLAPLTEGAGLTGHSVCMHADGRRAFFISDSRLQWVDVASGARGVAADVAGQAPGRLIPYPVSLTADGRFAALAAEPAGEGADKHATLLRVEPATGRVEALLERPEGFSHPMVCPTDPDLITFVPHGNACWNMDAPDDRRARTWLYDARAGAARPLLTPARYRVITHESWSPDGRRLFFFDKTYPRWCPVSISSADRDGGDWRAHFTSYCWQLGHGRCSSDGRHFISDCQKNGDSPLVLLDLGTGRHEVLCWPDASQDGGHAKAAHVHPSFSPTGRYVCYTSDRTGTPQVYVVPLGR